jgi:N-succinyldiaminopimelate aminotransferase
VVDPVAKAHQFLTFSTAPNLQTAVAQGLAWSEERFTAMRAEMQRSRDRLASGLARQDYVATASEGTYFLCVDLKASGIDLDDEAFCRRLVTEFGVAAIPVSAFMTGEDRAAGIVRLCFAKADAVLDEAVVRLGRAREALAR